MWNYLRSLPLIKLNVFIISAFVIYLIKHFNYDNIDLVAIMDTFNYYLSNYSLFNIETMYPNPEIQLALQNCENLGYIPERVFNDSIDQGITLSTSFLFNKIANLIYLYSNGQIDPEENFILVSGIQPSMVELKNIPMDNFNSYSENNLFHVCDLILSYCEIKVKEILPLIISYYQGKIDLDNLLFPIPQVIQYENSYCIIKKPNYIFYLHYSW